MKHFKIFTAEENFDIYADRLESSGGTLSNSVTAFIDEEAVGKFYDIHAWVEVRVFSINEKDV